MIGLIKEKASVGFVIIMFLVIAAVPRAVEKKISRDG